MASQEGYRPDLAFIHEDGFSTTAAHAAEMLIKALQKDGHISGLVVDLGCGAGTLAREVASRGFTVLGVDSSPSMIERARSNLPSGRFEVGSAFGYPIPRCVAVTAVGEVVNYLFDERNSRKLLQSLFDRCFRALVPGGFFVLDSASPGRVPGKGPRRSFFEGESWAVLVEASEQSDPPLLKRRITSFRREGDLYVRDQETHLLRLIPRATMLADLRDAGFRVRSLRAYHDFVFPAGWCGYLARKPA